MHCKLVTALAVALTTLPLCAAETISDDDIAYVATSRPHNLPRLLTLQTAEVLESYGIAFAGGGNIHSALQGNDDFFRGSLYIGLGDVAELGYEQENISVANDDGLKRMRGHIKLQLLQESHYVPALAISYGASLDPQDGLATDNLQLDRSQWTLGLAKSLEIGSLSISLHPAVVLQQDELSSTNANSTTNPVQKRRVDGQMGITWQRRAETMFLFEARTLGIIDPNSFATQALAYHDAVQANLGVRFYLRNWIFMDAGLLNTYDIDQDAWNNAIHANLTGIIPVKTVSERVIGWFGN